MKRLAKAKQGNCFEEKSERICQLVSPAKATILDGSYRKEGYRDRAEAKDLEWASVWVCVQRVSFLAVSSSIVK